MAPTATVVQLEDWHDRARSPALISAAEADAELTELRHQLSVKTNAAKMLNTRIRQLVAGIAAQDKKFAELEDALRQAREDLAHHDNESGSLHASLDLVTAENKSLSARVSELTVEAETLGARLDNSKSAVLAVEVERDRLATALREANELHRIEADSLHDRLEAMTSRSAAAECLLLDVRKSLQVSIGESDAAARKAADAIRAKGAADEAVGQLRASLQVKDNELRELEQSRAMLLAEAGTLLEAFEARVVALGEAEDRAKALAGRVADAEAKAALAHASTHSEIESLNLKLQSRQTGLDEALQAIEALGNRAAAAEANASAAQDEIQGLNSRLQSRQADLDETVDAIRSLVTRVAEAEAKASAAQDEIHALNLKLQDEQASRAAAEAALSKAQSDYSRLRGLIDSEQAQRKPMEQQPAEPKWAPLSSTTSMLAATISL
jgi:DNA repair exonuclease SbcCD ATPase subunit